MHLNVQNVTNKNDKELSLLISNIFMISNCYIKAFVSKYFVFQLFHAEALDISAESFWIRDGFLHETRW